MNKKINVKKINRIMESRFGFTIDFENLTMKNAIALAKGITEGLESYKKSHKIHKAERDPRYMEMIMVRESLNRWILANESRFIMESELAKSEAILAAKDMVDSVQDMLEKVSKMQNEQMPALIDAIRDQIGTDKAEQFKGSIAPVLKSLYDAITSGREQADAAARALAGEEVGSELGGMLGAEGEMPAMPGAEAELPAAPGSEDEFGGEAAAAGGTEELGRERR
jgi:hypothetical protein